MFESVKKKILVHPLLQGSCWVTIFPDTSKRRSALATVDQSTAGHVFDLLQQHGVNHIDVAASYGDAELRIGPWMDHHRSDFFLATKTGERGYETRAVVA